MRKKISPKSIDVFNKVVNGEPIIDVIDKTICRNCRKLLKLSLLEPMYIWHTKGHKHGLGLPTMSIWEGDLTREESKIIFGEDN